MLERATLKRCKLAKKFRRKKEIFRHSKSVSGILCQPAHPRKILNRITSLYELTICQKPRPHHAFAFDLNFASLLESKTVLQ